MKKIIAEELDVMESQIIELYAEAFSISVDEARDYLDPEREKSFIKVGSDEEATRLDRRVGSAMVCIWSARLRLAQPDTRRAVRGAMNAAYQAGIAMMALLNKWAPHNLSWQASPSEMASLVASIGRHKESRESKEFARKYWSENIDPKLSASKAANTLMKVVPYEHRTLQNWVYEWRKEQKKSTELTDSE